MKKLALLALVLVAQCFPVSPSHANQGICTTTCRTDSGGHLVCHTRCR